MYSNDLIGIDSTEPLYLQSQRWQRFASDTMVNYWIDRLDMTLLWCNRCIDSRLFVDAYVEHEPKPQFTRCSDIAVATTHHFIRITYSLLMSSCHRQPDVAYTHTFVFILNCNWIGRNKLYARGTRHTASILCLYRRVSVVVAVDEVKRFAMCVSMYK